MWRQFLFAPEGEAAPSGAQPTAVATPAAAAAHASTQVDPQTDPNWLKPRLEREAAAAQAKLLKELGVTDPAKAKEILAAAAKAEEEAKSTALRLGETSTKLSAIEQENQRLKEATATYASSQLKALTAEQQEAVRRLAPDTDPAAQLNAIHVLAPTWKTAAPAQQQATQTQATELPKPGAPPPANTAPPPNAPPSAAGSPPDHKAEYSRLKSSNPVAAAAYMREHADKIYPRA